MELTMSGETLLGACLLLLPPLLGLLVASSRWLRAEPQVLVGFLVLNRDVAEAGVAGTLALFIAPGLNLIAQIVLDDMADEWVRRESAGLLLAGILSGVLAVLGGRLRRICSYGSEPVPFAGPPRS